MWSYLKEQMYSSEFLLTHDIKNKTFIDEDKAKVFKESLKKKGYKVSMRKEGMRFKVEGIKELSNNERTQRN